MNGLGDTWAKVYDTYLETLLHRVRLLAERRSAAEAGEERTRAIAAHERALADMAIELVDLGARPPLDVLTDACGLSVFEADVVAAALAYELDPAVGHLLDARSDGSQPVTASLASELFAVGQAEAAELLDPGSPLQRFRLVRPGDGRLPIVQRPIRLEPRTLHYLRGRNQPDDELAGIIESLEPAPMVGPHRDVVERLVAWIGSGEGSDVRSRVNLVGPPDQGRTEVAVAVAHAVGLHAVRVDVDRLVARPDRLDLVRSLIREALLLPAALYVDAPETASDDPARATAIGELIADLEGLVFIASRERWSRRDRAVAVDVPRLTVPDRAQLWRDVLGEQVTGVDVDRIAEQFTLGPGGVVRAAAEIKARHDIAGGDHTTTGDVWAACRSFVGAELASLAQRITPTASWERLVLPERELALLRRLTDQVDHRSVVYEEWGIGALLNRGRGISALFTGPPGTGKTMAAEIIAGELDLDLYRIDLSSVVSKYIGETEKNLRKVFDAADQGGAILFFDEADALFGKRTEVKDSHDRHANVEINYLLQRMEDYAGLAILATNRKGDLDPAFLRRIRFIVSFPFPKADYRTRIWQTVLPDSLPRLPLDLDALGKLEIAGGNIRNVAVNAAFAAAAAGTPLSMDHLIAAAAHEYGKLDKLPTRGEFGDYYEQVRP